MKFLIFTFRITIILVVVQYCMVISVYGQQSTKRFKNLTIEDGLPQNKVDCMLQDQYGFMWFGTWNGLCRYDGYTFEVFDGSQSAKSLRSNFIHTLNQDQFGNIWIGTKEGLYVYLYNKGEFKLINDDFPTRSGKALPDIRSLSIHQDSILLVGSDRGLSAFIIKNSEADVEFSKHVYFGNETDELSGTIVNTILCDAHQNYWIGTDGGLVLISSKGDFQHYSEQDASQLMSDQVLKIFEANNGEIWVGTEQGLNVYDFAKRNFRQYHANPEISDGLVHQTVLDIVEDDYGNLLLATLGGLSILDRKSDKFTSYTSDFSIEHSLSNEFVNCLLKDANGNVWIGTDLGGVNFYTVNQNQIEHFEFRANAKNSLSHSTINSVFDEEKYLWIGTAGGGLNRFDKHRKQFEYYRHDAQNSRSISSDFVTAIHRDKNNNLWIGLWGGGLDFFDQKHEKFVHYRNGQVDGVISDFISSIQEDKNGNLWIGTYGGLIFYNQELKVFKPMFIDKGGVRISEVGCLLFDEQNNLYVGTRYGLYYLRFEQGTYRNPSITRFEQGAEGSISGDYVISLRQASDKTIWIGTYGQGLNKMHKESDSVWFESFNVSNGFSNTIIYGIEEDESQNLWLSTDYGLSKFNPATKDVRNYFSVDGFLNNQYYWSATYKNDQGQLFFGGMDGLDAFYPSQVKNDIKTPEVIITSIRLLNDEVIPGARYNDVEVMTQNVFRTENIELSYKEKAIDIEFTSLNYEEPSSIRYAYILEGFDKDWNYVSYNRRFASYTNLLPGDYTFKVKAAVSNENFDVLPRQIKIHIAPPFWETVLFKLLAILALVGIVFAYTRYRIYNLRRQKRVLEKQVAERTERINQQNEALSFQAIQLRNNNAELEEKQKLIEGQNKTLEHQNKEIAEQRDEVLSLNKKLNMVSQLKLSFFTNISHEFRTPLTLIIGPLERLIKEQQFTKEVTDSLNVMNRNAQRLLHLINQIMDFRKIEKGKMELNINKGNLNDFCKNLFAAFEPLASIKKISFSLKQEELPDEVWFDFIKIENILYNLLSNAFKYTKEGGHVALEVSCLNWDQSKLPHSKENSDAPNQVISIKIIDSGIGISEENLPLVFKRFYRIESEDAFRISGSGIGLALTEELIKTHHGEIFVESRLGEGSVFEIQFPSLKDDYGPHELTDIRYEGLNVYQQVEILKSELMLTGEAEDDGRLIEIDIDLPTVLIVEDSHDLRSFISHKLRKTYNVVEAENGLEGLLKADKFAPDIIISDVMMPKMDGLEFCTKIKGNINTSHIPVILLTAKSAIEDQLQGLQMGADDYLPKPFNFDLLELKIQNFLENRKRLKALFAKSEDMQISELATTSKDQKFLERARDLVIAEIGNSEFGVKEFVEAMGISRSLLHKKLTSLTDQSAAEFINSLKMKKAKALLMSNELNISEVAYAVGYNDPKYFSRLFSKHFGQSPSEYQEQTIL